MSIQTISRCRGLRGAIIVPANDSGTILSLTRRLLAVMIYLNRIEPDEVAALFFTATDGLDACFPALAVRQIGWDNVPTMCAREMNVPGAPNCCIRVMLLWNTEKLPEELINVYLEGARGLRPDEPPLPPVDWKEIDSWIDMKLKIFEARDNKKSR